MSFPTTKGRLQTKLLTYIILALVAAIFAGMYGSIYVGVFCIAAIVGLVLELLCGWLIPYQAGYVAFILGSVEFCVIIFIASLFEMPMAFMDALVFYLTAWVLIQLFLIYILPVIHPSWGDDGLELW